MDRAAVGQDDAQLQHVVDGLAVDDRVGAGRVVGDHAADRRPVGRRDVRGELQAVRPHLQVEVVEHAAGLDAAQTLGRVDFQHVVEVLGAVEDDPGPMHCPACDVPPPRAVSGTPEAAQTAPCERCPPRVRGSTTPSGTIW